MKITVNRRRVYGKAMDGVTLREHDMHYHDGHYRGGKCLFRERLNQQDHTIDDLEDANQKEGTIYSARRYEGKMLEEKFNEEFDIGQKKGFRTQLYEPDKDGVFAFRVECPPSTENSVFPADRLRKFFKGSGYELRTGRVRLDTHAGKAGRKIFTFGLYRPEKYEWAKESEHEVGEVVRVGGGDMGEADKNRALKRFGVKSEGGSIRRRTGDDNRLDRIRKYMGMVGDWEGQSTREDSESGEWEKKRLAMLKRAKEAASKESEEA